VLGGRYRLVRPIARGGMAAVWEGEDPLLSRRVAIKILDPALATDEALRARFRHEAIAAARLAHPNIVATYDTGEDDGAAFIVMELVDGVTLRGLLDSQGALSVGEAVDVTMQVAAALAHAHEHGLVHRDVKPGNVLVQRDGHVKVTDFGIAKATDAVSDLTRAGSVMGTARYLAPEQVREGEVDARADVYSLALVLYELLAGRAPFAADTDVATAVARLTNDPPSVRATRPDVPIGLDDALRGALAREPRDRTPTARAFRESLAPFRGGAPPAADATRPVVVPRPPAAPIPADESRARSRVGWVLGLVLLFAVGAGLGYAGFRAVDDARTTTTTTTPTTAAPAPLGVQAVEAFDPLGTGGEDSANAGNVVDANPDTSWSTESYESADLDKDGVGLQFTLDEPAAVRAVEVGATAGPWNAAVYVAAEPFTAAPSGPAAATGTALPADATLVLDPPASGRFVLLWITELPEGGSGPNPFQLTIDDVRIFA
jgi:serine/threonine-protein kinase